MRLFSEFKVEVFSLWLFRSFSRLFDIASIYIAFSMRAWQWLPKASWAWKLRLLALRSCLGLLLVHSARPNFSIVLYIDRVNRVVS